MSLIDPAAHDGGVLRIADHPGKRSALSRLVAEGRLIKALPGVLMHPDLNDDADAWLRAVLLWQPNAIISGRLAANWGMGLTLDVAEVLVSAKTRMKKRGLVRFQYLSFPTELLEWGPDVCFTGAEATCLAAGLAGDFDPATAALRGSRVTPESLLTTARRWPGRHHSERLELARELSRNPWSVAELQLHRLLRGSGIIGWTGNHAVTVAGNRFVIDVALPRMKLGFEVNSFEFHSTREAMERDSSRMNALAGAGWTVYVLTPRQITEDPDETVEFIRSVVNKRHKRGRGGHSG
ncbi:DUF559 domain-containing protein [Tessaracoccus sp. OS52]|uniref:DUF559 domain-containing protein n=1 Tax=Tessaracoccus sp. OS52 TaxID=2886691 RepID=UPI001D12F8A8|nr:DUF559 domain-containing protein [Tessaracoccus sp. OS52]MCC2592332.1 DUF559 domain-containing protein [Tessaracoccus sp. OS52]